VFYCGRIRGNRISVRLQEAGIEALTALTIIRWAGKKGIENSVGNTNR
jgi:hypothetical protein